MVRVNKLKGDGKGEERDYKVNYIREWVKNETGWWKNLWKIYLVWVTEVGGKTRLMGEIMMYKQLLLEKKRRKWELQMRLNLLKKKRE